MLYIFLTTWHSLDTWLFQPSGTKKAAPGVAMVDSSSTTAMPVVTSLYDVWERGRNSNIVSTGVLRGGGRPGDGELHGGLHGAVHELEQVQGILHLHGIKLLQVELSSRYLYFTDATKNCGFFTEEYPQVVPRWLLRVRWFLLSGETGEPVWHWPVQVRENKQKWEN